MLADTRDHLPPGAQEKCCWLNSIEKLVADLKIKVAYAPKTTRLNVEKKAHTFCKRIVR